MRRLPERSTHNHGRKVDQEEDPEAEVDAVEVARAVRFHETKTEEDPNHVWQQSVVKTFGEILPKLRFLHRSRISTVTGIFGTSGQTSPKRNCEYVELRHITSIMNRDAGKKKRSSLVSSEMVANTSTNPSTSHLHYIKKIEVLENA